eukprot:scaffold60536_cov31-Phaeocystis_antarctica.AAC.1
MQGVCSEARVCEQGEGVATQHGLTSVSASRSDDSAASRAAACVAAAASASAASSSSRSAR